MLTFVLECLASVCLVVFCAIGALFTRRVMIRRRGGTFDCSLRLTPAVPGVAWAAVRSGPVGSSRGRPGSRGGSPAPAPVTVAAGGGDRIRVRGTRTPFTASGVREGRGWSYGIAQYRADHVDWYRIFSYAFRPAAVLTRRDLRVLGRREPQGHEESALFPGWTILECGFGAGHVELALAEDALTGFLSWLEAAPPGQNVSRVS